MSEIEVIPSIALFPSNKKEKPIVYEYGLDWKDVKRFLKSHGVYA
jgi:hypothetical protein